MPPFSSASSDSTKRCDHNVLVGRKLYYVGGGVSNCWTRITGFDPVRVFFGLPIGLVCLTEAISLYLLDSWEGVPWVM